MGCSNYSVLIECIFFRTGLISGVGGVMYLELLGPERDLKSGTSITGVLRLHGGTVKFNFNPSSTMCRAVQPLRQLHARGRPDAQGVIVSIGADPEIEDRYLGLRGCDAFFWRNWSFILSPEKFHSNIAYYKK